jgi:hypothetical protein
MIKMGAPLAQVEGSGTVAARMASKHLRFGVERLALRMEQRQRPGVKPIRLAPLSGEGNVEATALSPDAAKPWRSRL